MERLRSITISYEIDTNKRTENKTFVLGEYNENEDIGELLERATTALHEDLGE